jgi:hypothetical protein
MLRFVLLGGISATMWGQAMVEYGLGIAAAGTAGAPGQAASRGIAGIFSNLQKTLNSTAEAAKAPAAGAPAPAPAVQPKRTAGVRPGQSAAMAPPTANPEPAEAPKPTVVYEDPAAITVGLERAELLSRFGEPAMKITASAGRESMTYQTKDGNIEVEVRNGKVTAVQGKAKPKQTAVVVLQ